MADILVTSPYRPFTLPSQFKAVFNGFIYCGTVDAVDPSNSQVQVYKVNEDGSRIPVAQPLRTNAGGFLVYNGQPAKFVTDSNHSLLVRDSLGVQVWYAPDVRVADPENLATDLTSNGGAAIIGSEAGLTVQQQIGDKIIVRPVGNPAGDKAALLAAAASAAATGMAVHTLKGDVFTIDNSAGTGITFTQDDFQLTGLGKIKSTHDTNTLVHTTGARAKVHKGIKLEGPGTHRPDLGGTGNPPALLKMTGEDSDSTGCWFIEPYCAGVFFTGMSGGLIKKNTITCSYSGPISLPFIFGISTYACDTVNILLNVIDGCIQGISGGGDGSGSIVVVGKDGASSSKLRNITVNMNTCVNQLDHSIYFSNDTQDISILNNKGLKSVNDLIKIEGGPNTVDGNTGIGGSAVTGRNIHGTIINNNIITTTTSSPSAYGIICYEQQFKREFANVSITNNQLTHVDGAESKGAIYVIGDYWDGYQSLISALTIDNNKCKGYGATSEGFGIRVRQNLVPGTPLTGSLGTTVDVTNNQITFPPHTVPSYGIELGYGLYGGKVQGNEINGFRTQGVRSLGVRGFNMSGNVLKPPVGVSVTGFYERPHDTNVHINSTENKYADNTYLGTFSREVVHADQTTYNADRKVIRRTSGLSSDSIDPTQWPKMVVYNNHSAGAVITLLSLASSPWPIDIDVEIVNAGVANSLTVNPGGYVVTAGTSLKLVSTGSNTWIKAN